MACGTWCSGSADDIPTARQTHPASHDRRHRRLQDRRADPPVREGRGDGAGHDDRGRRAVHHRGDDAGAVGPGRLHQSVGRTARQQHGPHQPQPRGRRDAGGARQRRRHRRAGAGQGGRPRQPDRAGPSHPRMPAAGRAGDEPRDVGPPGHAAQRGPDSGRWRDRHRPGQRRPGLRRNRRRPHAGGAGDLRRGRGLPGAQDPARQEALDHRWPHLRGHRPGARHHQPQQRQDGFCDRACRRGSGCRGHAGQRPGAPAHAARRAAHRCAERAADGRHRAAAGVPPARLHCECRRRRLAPHADASAQDEEGRGRCDGADPGDDREPGHPRRRREAAPAALLRRLCRRKRKAGRARRCQAPPQGDPAHRRQPRPGHLWPRRQRASADRRAGPA
mmetsp:Transcript_57668/g.135788  ORF Transcript_57668/g.135788 Transcript_57668/m.135788 type:complete len:390 (-) Transcript_57668:69-1238(-)